MKQKRFKKVVIWDFEPINQDLSSINIDHIVKLFVYPLFLIFYGLVGIFYLIFYPFYIGLALLLCFKDSFYVEIKATADNKSLSTLKRR